MVNKLLLDFLQLITEIIRLEQAVGYEKYVKDVLGKKGLDVKGISKATIGKLIEAHYEKDEHKFKAYANFIAEAYKERGEERAERIIRSRIDGSYKDKLRGLTSLIIPLFISSTFRSRAGIEPV